MYDPSLKVFQRPRRTVLMVDKVMTTDAAGLSPQNKRPTARQETGDNASTTNQTLTKKRHQTVLVWSQPTWTRLPHSRNRSCRYQYATCPVTTSKTKRKCLQNVNMPDNDITPETVFFINIYPLILVSTRSIQNTDSRNHTNNTKHTMMFLNLQLCLMQHQ